MRRDSWNFRRGLVDDGLYLPTIKEHSFEKIHRHNYYAEMFTTSMWRTWPQMAYLGLYSGAGRACVEPTGEIVETTALSTFRLPHPFTKYIFVDRDPECANALEKRIASLGSKHDAPVLVGDVNDLVPKIRKELPRYSKDHGLLSFCFVDPCDARLKFQTIEALGKYRMDFLVLLALGMDTRRNFRRYFDDLSDTRIGDLIDDRQWRREYAASADASVVRFVLRKFNAKMVSLGYKEPKPEHHHRVLVRGRGVMQYMLVLYSKHKLGQFFWETALSGSNPQTSLGF